MDANSQCNSALLKSTAIHGWASPCPARQGPAGQGRARPGAAGLGKARQGVFI